VVGQAWQFEPVSKGLTVQLRNEIDIREYSRIEKMFESVKEFHKEELKDVTLFHSKTIKPFWIHSNKVEFFEEIGNHRFYKEKRCS
jgi:spore germination cell wall hydrolase CwlJ-like protein